MPGLICLREKLWTRTYSIGDQVPTCPVFTRAKIKSRFGILVNLPSHFLFPLLSKISLIGLWVYRVTGLYFPIPILSNLILRHDRMFSSVKSVRYFIFLFDELCKQNLSFSILPMWTFMFPQIMRTLCLECDGQRKLICCIRWLCSFYH